MDECKPLGGGAPMLGLVLRACLTLAGKRLSGCSQTKQTVSQAEAWCACSLRVLHSSPTAALSSEVYHLFRAHFVRFPSLGSLMLAAVDRGGDKNHDLSAATRRLLLLARPLVTLAIVSSKSCGGNVERDAVGKLAMRVRKLAPEAGAYTRPLFSST